MRHSIKRISKSALSVVLALMMVVSTIVVGIVTVSAFDLKGTYNFDNYTAKWDKVYLVKVGNDGSYTEYQEMTAGSDGIYSCTLGSWGGSSFYFANSNSNPTATTAKFTSAVDSTNNCFVPSSATGTSINGTWMTTAQAIEQHGGSSGSDVTGDLLSVLKGEKVMFYYGDLWNSGTKYIRTSSSTSNTLDSGSDTKRTITKNSTSYSYYSRSVTAASSKYYISNSSSWSGVQMNENAVAGKAYVLNNNSTFSGGSSNNVVSFSAGTTTVTTTADSAIQNGSKLSVSTSDTGSSVVGVKNSVKYYITSDNSAYSEYTLTDGKLDTSSLTDGTYTLKSVLTDGTIYVVGDTDTFTVSSKTDLAKPNYSVSNSNVVTSKANATITVTSSGDSYPSGTTYTLLDASDNVVSGVTWNGNVATVEFADLSSDTANYKVKVSADEATYNPAVSDEFNLKKVQLYAVTLAENADAVVTGTYTDAYGESGKTIAEGKTADVPSGYKVTVNATLSDTTNKTFNKFTYNGSDYSSNPSDITITADGTISTIIDTVTYRTVKIAVIEYADKEHHGTGSNYLSTNDVTYTFGGSTKTATMTAVEEDPTAYFVLSGKWSGNGNLYYIYEVQVPSTVTSINVDGKKSITLDDTTEFYGIYHFSDAGGWNVQNFNQADRYYYVNVVANTDVDSGATVSATGSASVKYNQDTSRTLYKYQSTIDLTATPSNATAFSYDHWSDGTSNIDSPYTVVGDATLTAFFKANQTYAINLVNTDANLASITSSPATSTYKDNTVKVTVTAKSGYECTGITVKTATDVDVTVTKNPDGTYSFTMPGEDVTVTPTIAKKAEYTYALVGDSTIKDSNGTAAAWNGSETLDQAAFDTASSLKFTNNKLVVTASSGDQFRFIGTDGSKYYHYGSANNSNETIVYGKTYNTTLGDKLVYKFNEAGTFEIEITSGTDSPMSFKVTKLASYYVVGRFAIKNSDGTYTSTTSTSLSNKPTDNFWNVNNKNISFSYDSGSIYKLNTGLTVNELTVSGNPWYFRIYDGTDTYYRPSFDTALKASDAKSKYNTDTSTDKNFYFNDSDESGIVILCFDASTKQFYFEIETGKTPLDAPTIASDRASLTAKNPTATITVTPATYPEGVDVEYYLYNGGTYVATTTGTTFTVSSAGTYTVKAYPPADNPNYKESVASNSVTIADGRTPVAVKAMNGIMNGDVYTGTTTAEAANTSSSVVWNESSDLSGGKEYTVTKGSTVKVITTMVADTESAEKFVYAYVVNNKDTYLATEGIAVTDAEGKKYATYSATFTIAEDATDTTFTVVPIYYYKACANDGEYIKFYVDKSDTTSWGNNLYNYAYYYKTAGDTEDVYRSDGTWPGQPMLYDETKQLYYSLVPKQIGGKLVSGLTVNIGSDTLQSFDFDDFKVINEIGYDIVRLDLKQRSGHSSNKDKLVVSYDDTNNVFNDLTYNPANLVSDFSGRWEAYKDINGNDVSLLGKAVNTDNTNTTYIVSSATHTSGERGQWMSAFSVYKVANDGTVTYVTTAFPSDFIPRIVQDGQTEATANTSAYNAILNAGLGDAPVKIVYEDQVSTRIDGRWYYAQSDSEVSAYAYYRTTDNGTTYSELKQDAAYASVDGAVSVTNPKLGLEISVVSSPLAGYIFDHWSVADKDGNIIINKLDNVGSAFTTTLDQEMHYVANFRKATSGQLVINHSKYTGSDAKNGLGYYRLEVQVKKSDGTWSTVYAGSGTGANGQSVTIADLVETDQIIRIKLITETAGENTFRYWYTTSSDGTEIIEDPDGDMTWNGTATSEPTGKNGILTYTFDTEVWKLFRDHLQKVTQLNFYSDIAPMNKNYKLTYKYTDRFGKEKIYVVKGTHDDAYYVKNNNSWAPSDQLITDNAPPIDDLYKNCTWIIANSNKDGTDATLVAVQNGKTYKVDIYDASGASESYTLPINSYVKNSAGEFFVADEYIMDGETKKYFSYWAVYKRVVKDGKVTRGEEVARHFYREYTLVVLDDYWIEPVYGAERNDQVYISAPQYTREKYSNEDGTVVKDSLYVDFMVAYMSAAGDLIRNDVSGDKYQTGLIIEIGQNKVLGTNEDSSVNTDYSGITYDSNLDTVKSAANNLTGSPTKYSFATGDNRKLYNFRATNTNYNNMNRLDYAVPFTNTENNRMYVMKAYYYVIIDSEIVLSNPVYFNLYEIGTSDPITE